MRTTPILTAAFIAAGCTFAVGQTGGGTGTGAGADAGTGAGAAAGVDAGAGAGASAGATAGAAQGSSTGIGGDTRPRRSPLTGVYRRGDDMAPLVIPQEEYVRMRRSRQW